MKLNRLRMILLWCMVMLLLCGATYILAQMTVDPTTHCEISWDGGGTWIPVLMTNVRFSMDPLEPNRPFLIPGMNRFQADVSNVWLADPMTTLEWVSDIQLPPDDGSGTIYKTGWIHYMVTVEDEGDSSTTDWSEMRAFHVKTPKKPRAPRVLRN